MSREEAIRIIKIVLAIAEDFEITVQGEEFTEEKCKEAVEMATKALEQEPNTDVLDKIRAEIEREYKVESEHPYGQGLRRALEIIDKYRNEVSE